MKGYTAVHQFHSGTAFGDAITNQMLALRGQLRGLGYESEVFANLVAPEFATTIKNIRAYEPSRSSLLLFHHSMGSDYFHDVLVAPHDIVTVYHNITPAALLSDPTLREYSLLGREQLAVLADRSLLGIADSNFNRREMLAVGFRRVEVLPVRTDFPKRIDRVGDLPPSDDWLFVGRVVASKGQCELVDAFANYVKHFPSSARLYLVGDLSDAAYVDELRRRVIREGVTDRVVLTGKLTDVELAAAYAQAGVFVSLSEHEGFGVPLLEAMAARVPVLAFDAAAVSETMGGAGILLKTKDAPIVAATVQAMRTDAALRQRLVDRQSERVHAVRSFDVSALLRRVVQRASGGPSQLRVQIQGPFETSYSLAVLNRNLALELDRRSDMDVTLYATEGPGDYTPQADDLAAHPEAAALYAEAATEPYPDVVIRQMYPARFDDSPGGLTFSYFGWEESRLPDELVERFNRNVAGIGVMSNFVEETLRRSGVTTPIAVVGVGVEPHDPQARFDADELEGLRSFRFLNIGSAFPRKGMDALIEAYFGEFDGSDDVTLILKSFPNPHNTMAQLLERARANHANPPDVRWIDREVNPDGLRGLYNAASCYVHPARGEGFGLPVAEAMLAEVPVITLDYSGLADFVSQRTALTIAYTVAPADTHLSVPGSTWAEPDIDALRSAMRWMTKNAKSAQTTERTIQARKLIEDQFSWSAVAARWAEFIRRTEVTQQSQDVALVSTWNSRCGIAEYSASLLGAIRNSIRPMIFANRDAETVDPRADVGVTRCWTHRWNPDLDPLRLALNRSDTDVVHLQFNSGFFNIENFACLIEQQLPRRGVVVTFHRTQDLIDETEGLISLRSIAPTLSRADCLIVHQQADAERLAEMGVRGNVVVVPIGTPNPPTATPDEVRMALRLGDRPIVGTFGFLLPHKGVLALLDSIDRLRGEFPDIALLAMCATYPISTSHEYEKLVREHIASRQLEDNVLLVSDYLPADIAATTLRAADVVVLPYEQTEESASAALRFVMAIERPVVVTDLAIFADAAEAVYRVPAKDADQLDEAVRKFIRSDSLREQWSHRSAAYSRATSWSRIAAEHEAIYALARDKHRARV